MAPSGKCFLFLLIICSLISSCSQRRFVPSSAGESLGGSFFCYPFTTVTVKKAKFRFEDGSQTASGLSSFYLKRDSAFFFTASLLGMEGLRGLLSSDSLYVISRTDQVFYKSPAAAFSTLLGFPFSPALFFPLFSGSSCEALLNRAGFHLTSSSGRKENYEDSTRRFAIELLFSGRTTEIATAWFSDLVLGSRCQIFFSEYRQLSGNRVPTHLRFLVTGAAFPNSPSLQLQLQDVVFNENRSVILTKPKSYHEKAFR